MTDISINGRKLSEFNPASTSGDEYIYSQKDLDDARESVIDRVLEVISEFEEKPVRCKDSVYIIKNDELWDAIKLHLITEIMTLRGNKE